MTGMDLGVLPSYPAPMIRTATRVRYQKMAGFPQGSAPPRALAQLC